MTKLKDIIKEILDKINPICKTERESKYIDCKVDDTHQKSYQIWVSYEIRRRMNNARLTTKMLSEYLDLREDTASDYLIGKVLIPRNIAMRICKILNCEYTEIYDRQGYEEYWANFKREQILHDLKD